MFLEIEGRRLYYECAGDGDMVVLLHGWGGSADSFTPLFDHLSKSFKVFSIDFPGFGRSEAPPEPWGAVEYGKLVMRFFRETGIERTHVIAHSFGGRVALWLAAFFPERVNRLILVGGAGIKPRRKAAYYLKVGVAKAGKKIFTLPIFGKYGDRLLAFIYRLVGSKDYQAMSGVMRSTLVKVVNEDLRGLLPKVKAPTLLVWGENDEDVPLSSGKIMEKEIKDAGLVVLKGAGHFSYLDRFNEFRLIADNFLYKGND